MPEQAKEALQEEEIIETPTTDETLTETQTPADEVADNAVELTELEKAQAEAYDWKDKYLRLYAEFDNFKKRSFKEKMEVIQTGGKDVIVSLLDVLDDSARAEKQLDTATDVQAVKEGLQLVFNKLKNTLQQKGLKAFDSIGEPFDVEKHEAVTEIPAPTPALEGKVIDELNKGYYLNDKLIRHAKVVVGKMPND